MPNIEEKKDVPIPEELRLRSPLLLDLLETWQEALPNLQRDFELEELSEVDQALSFLIVQLRDLNDNSQD